jgi:hypothetical protein
MSRGFVDGGPAGSRRAQCEKWAYDDYFKHTSVRPDINYFTQSQALELVKLQRTLGLCRNFYSNKNYDVLKPKYDYNGRLELALYS